MKVTRFLVSLLFLSAVSTSAFAQGLVSLTWDNCTGPIDKAVGPGVLAGMFGSVINHSAPHKAYEVDVTLGSPGGLRDAWRFDAAGCQGSAGLTIDHLSPAATSKTCPSFQGIANSLQIKDYSYDATTGKARGLMADSYPTGSTSAQQIPTQRYFLVRFLFDHTFSVPGAGVPGQTCGGVEVPVCAHITKAIWLDLGGNEFAWTVEREYVTANDPNNTTRCPGATATRATTWGSLKNQYR